MGVRWLEIRFHTSWFAVVLPTKVADIWGENREEGREIGVGEKESNGAQAGCLINHSLASRKIHFTIPPSLPPSLPSSLLTKNESPGKKGMPGLA